MKSLMTVFFILYFLVGFSQVALMNHNHSYNILIADGANVSNFGTCNVMIDDELVIGFFSNSYNWRVDYNCEYLQNRPVLAMQILAYEKAIKNTPHCLWLDLISKLQDDIKVFKI